MDSEKLDKYMMAKAWLASEQATCPRRHVGAVLVLDGDDFASGYNGSEPGAPHCDEVGCFMVDGHCEGTIHAEMNAVLRAAKKGRATQGATCYSTTIPCYRCQMHLRTAGIVRFVWPADDDYVDRPGNPREGKL